MGYYFIRMLFYGIPIAVILFFVASLCSYFEATKKNKAVADSYSAEELKHRKTMVIVSSVILGVMLVVMIGLICLVYMSIAYM